MFGVNEGNIDRGVRVVVGATLAWLGFGSTAVTGGVAVALGIAGVILMITGVTGFCGMYKLFGIDTCPRR